MFSTYFEHYGPRVSILIRRWKTAIVPSRRPGRRREEGGRLFSQEDKRVEVPTACALFPEELLAWPPRSYVERLYNVRQWTEMPRGGNFAAMEEPHLLIEDLQLFARGL